MHNIINKETQGTNEGRGKKASLNLEQAEQYIMHIRYIFVLLHFKMRLS